ncbi:MAG: hypothetical protein ACP5M5_13295 [Acidibrevibacterium sp.]|uniref:hypothetical protein n=1 Tax=Acidibrevibacterium sp. TaxID=2606776 RepID=UPI003D0006B9
MADAPPDPLADLAARAKRDPAIAFSTDVLESLAELRVADRGRFEAMRAELKRAGVRVGALDPMICTAAGDEGRRQTEADFLIVIAGDCELFHVSDGTAFADIRIAGRRETWPVKSGDFDAGSAAPSMSAMAARPMLSRWWQRWR